MISFRITTLAALLVGVIFGLVSGAFMAKKIAMEWPDNDYFETRRMIVAPSPLRFGVIDSGESVLCDKHNYAYDLTKYEWEHEVFGLVSRQWMGFQELTGILYEPEPNTEPYIDTPMRIIKKYEQVKCVK